MMSHDDTVAALFRRQHGVAALRQLAAVGVSRKAVARRTANRRWLRVGPRVVRLAGTVATWESQVMAHVLAAGGDAVASHRSAAVLWALDGCRPGTPEITIARGRRYRPADAVVHESRDLDRVRPVRRAGIPTTPVERTLLDLGAVVSRQVVVLATDSAHRSGATDWDRLLDCLVQHGRRGRDGVGALRSIIGEHADEVGVTGSVFERLVHVLLTEAGLPRPVLQHDIRIGDHTYRPDLAYLDARLAIELDGTVHLRRDVWEHDHRRQNALTLAGWTILRFTWNDYRNRRTHIVREVRAALRTLG